MSELKQTHRKRSWQLGFAEASAVSLSFQSYDRLTRQLHTKADGLLTRLAASCHLAVPHRFRAAQPLLLLLRDWAAIAVYWGTAVRAHNACILRGQDLQDRRGHSLLSQLLASHQFPFSPGFEWQFAPNGKALPVPACWQPATSGVGRRGAAPRLPASPAQAAAGGALSRCPALHA